MNRPLLLLTLGTIYQTKVGNAEKAQEIYHKLIETFPDSQLSKLAKTQLERMDAPESAPGAAAIPEPAFLAPSMETP